MYPPPRSSLKIEGINNRAAHHLINYVHRLGVTVARTNTTYSLNQDSFVAKITSNRAGLKTAGKLLPQVECANTGCEGVLRWGSGRQIVSFLILKIMLCFLLCSCKQYSWIGVH